MDPISTPAHSITLNNTASTNTTYSSHPCLLPQEVGTPTVVRVVTTRYKDDMSNFCNHS
jgi:hypothetical protein